ncbi:MAG: FIG01121307: hypothetical protein, partial [uncultured Nocardioidaceae bacterium]
GRPNQLDDHDPGAASGGDGGDRGLSRLPAVGPGAAHGAGAEDVAGRPRPRGLLRARRGSRQGRLHAALRLARGEVGRLGAGDGEDDPQARRQLRAGAAGRRHRGHLPPGGGAQHPDDRDASAPRREGHHRHGAQGPQGAGRVVGL